MKTTHFYAAASYLVFLGTLCVLLAGVQVIRWALDYMPPFSLLDYSATPAKPGQMTTIRANVRRDLKRRCGVHYSRSFSDAIDARTELTAGEQYMNADALDALNRMMPDKLALSVLIPSSAAPGIGVVMVVLDYQCNPLQTLYPISMVLLMNVEVLP